MVPSAGEMAKDGGGGRFVIQAMRIAVGKHASTGLINIALDMQMTSQTFRLSFLDRSTLRWFRRYLQRDERLQFDLKLHAILEVETPNSLDSVTRGHVVFAAAAVCSMRAMRQCGTCEQEAMRRLTQSITSYGRRMTYMLVWLSTRLARDAFAAVRYYSAQKANHTYGPTFDIREQSIPGGFVSEVHTCGYRSFLARHHALELLPLFCAWDYVWIDALPKSILFRRPQTIAEGAETCRFEFRRAESATSGADDTEC